MMQILCSRLLSLSRLMGMICLLSVTLFLQAQAQEQPTPPIKEWTVLVYMNGKNSLEQAELDNFNNLAQVGSSAQVAILAELGRPQNHNSSEGGWSGVYRFYIQRGMRPIPEDKVMDLAASGENTDMGRSETLSKFIEWGTQKYPARRYMLIICNHGQGWRLELANASVSGYKTRDLAPSRLKKHAVGAVAPIGGFRAVSKDEDTGSILFNHEIEEVILKQFGPKGLSILGFDACLMAMTETAYEFQPSTDVLVASEDLEPSNGWNYSDWMAKLRTKPTSSNTDIGRSIVESYRDQNRDEYMTTLSAVDLDNFRADVSKLSMFADALIAAGPAEISNLRSARAQLRSYGDWWSPPSHTSVDLITVLERFEKLTGNQSLRSASAEVRGRLRSHLIDNYASKRSADANHNPYGSQGIAIYFPESNAAFLADDYHRGYLKSNKDRPVEFVKNERWPDLLNKILRTK